MIAQDALFAAELDATQWRAEHMQLVNWGGFHGHHRIEFAPGATLITGATGSGKSTILDAYLALMMDSNTPFNGASNDATVGRARSKEQRNLLTYLRGKLDDTTTDGEDTARVLRGANKATWGAISVTFTDGAGTRFTAARLYHVARYAAADTDITKRLCTLEGTIDLRDAAELAQTLFKKQELEARFRNLTVHSTYTQFAATLQARLGIGSHGDGSNALRLLARIQAGKTMPTVDDLFKEMVLETPATFAVADAAAAHFVDLEDAYVQMVAAEQKQSALEGIAETWKLRETQREVIAAVDGLRLDDRAPSPFLHWAAVTEARLVADAIEANTAKLDDAVVTHRELAGLAKQADGRYRELERAHREAGGGAIEDLDRQLAEATAARSDAIDARARFENQTAALERRIATEADLRDAKAAAEEFLTHGHDDAQRALADERSTVERQELWPTQNSQEELRKERESLQGRTGRVPEAMHTARVEAAASLGVDPSELPFVAELIDLAEDQGEWRDAAELALGAVTRIMLVDARLLDTLAVRIDRLEWRTRLNYQGVEPRNQPPVALDPAMLSGKLVYAQDSPFTWWVQERLTRDDTDALCVDRPEDLAGPGRRVTRSGQTRQGRRGAHGRSNRQRIIGFDSASRIAEIDEDLRTLDATITTAKAELAAIERRGRHLTELRDAHRSVIDTSWAAIDVETPDRRIAALAKQRELLLSSDDRLAELSRQLRVAERERDNAKRDEFLAENAVKTLRDTIAVLEVRAGQLTDEIARLVDAGCAHTDAQAEFLGTLDLDGTEYDADGFAKQLADAARALKARRASAEEQVQAAERQLTRTFKHYQERWPDPNIGVGIESYPDYAEILEGITASGLSAKREEWAHRVAVWAGEDLLPLHMAFDEAVEAIKARLAPVNDILDGLAFGAHRDRLRLELRHIHRDDQARFRKQLKELSSGVLDSRASFDVVEARFKQLRAFIERIRPDPTTKGRNRDYYLDVRHHIELSAVALDADGNVRAKYTSLGGKSGGETQELVAFIVGAALRYQLGDETRSVPRFAPVFLDEGFVKADSQFAGRSVQAWRGLGFQLIVATAFGTAPALEPHMDEVLAVTKNTDTGRARVHAMVDRAP